MATARSAKDEGSRTRRQARPLVSLPRFEGQGLFCEPAWRGIVEILDLSSRQQDVLRLALADRSDKEIASLLVLSRDTVRTHMKRLYEKLYVHSRRLKAGPAALRQSDRGIV